MKLLVDTNVILDNLTNREPFADDACQIFELAAEPDMEIAITANAVTDIAYLLHRASLSKEDIQSALLGLLELFYVISVGKENCLEALHLPMNDFEDAVVTSCAKAWNAELIITRNTKDFLQSPVQAKTPADFLKEYKNSL